MRLSERRVSRTVLSGRTTVVTGASRGLGLEVARFLCSQGAKVALCSRNHSEVLAVAEALREEYGADVWGSPVDVSSAIDTERFSLEVLEHLGPADVIINNAAVLGPVGNLQYSRASSWSDCLDVNVKGVAFMTAAFLDQLEQSDAGRVVNLSGGGVGGPTPMLRVSAYVASKYAIAGLTEVLASEFAESSVTINAIAPGALPTTFMAGVVEAGPEVAGNELFADASSRSGAVTAADLSPFLRLLNFLISKESSHISGRLLSARWDSPELLQALSARDIDDSLFRVRRIDNALFAKVLQ